MKFDMNGYQFTTGLQGGGVCINFGINIQLTRERSIQRKETWRRIHNLEYCGYIFVVHQMEESKIEIGERKVKAWHTVVAT
jgi:hypothetical protein